VEITGIKIERYEVVTEDNVNPTYLDPREQEQKQGEAQSEQEESDEESADADTNFAELFNEMQMMNS